MSFIRRANENDIQDVTKLLYQVNEIHHIGRPDLFKTHNVKYKVDELRKILVNDKTPVFVYEENGRVVGYVFGIVKEPDPDFAVPTARTFYIDDICVDEGERGKHIGRKLCDYAVEYAKSIGCYNVTLNVWMCNPSALKFYEGYGFAPQKIGMEIIL